MIWYNIGMANVNWWTVGLLVFMPFSVFVMKQPVSWNYAAAAVCIFGAVYFIFRG